jgi:hypothetical protein
VNIFEREFVTMFNRRFLQSRLGQAAAASTAAMALFVALSGQIQAQPAHAATAPVLSSVQLA